MLSSFWSDQFQSGLWLPRLSNQSSKFLILMKWRDFLLPIVLLEVSSLTISGMLGEGTRECFSNFTCFWSKFCYDPQGNGCCLDNPTHSCARDLVHHTTCHGRGHVLPWPTLFTHLHHWLHSGRRSLVQKTHLKFLITLLILHATDLSVGVSAGISGICNS